MAESSLFQKGFSEGFEDLFDEDKFKEKQKYANFIFWIALIVEILAASIGLFFAWSTGYNAYDQIPLEERTTSTFIYAVQGSLPFFLIAVIEPLKIPLAGGLYMVSDLRWKFLIFIALMGLTLVTFETMFTSFEQNLTNVNGAVIKQNNTIEKINGKLINLKIEEKKLNEETEDGVTKKIKKQNESLLSQKDNEIEVINAQFNSSLKPLEDQKRSKTIVLNTLQTSPDVSIENQKKNIESLILAEEKKREQIDKKAAKAINNYKQSLITGTTSEKKEIQSKIRNFKDENNRIEDSIRKLDTEITNLRKELSIKLTNIDKNKKIEIEKLNKAESSEIKEIENNNFFTAANKIAQARESYTAKRQLLNSDFEDRIESEKQIINPLIERKQDTIIEKNNRIKANNNEISNLLKTNTEIIVPDQKKIDDINKKRNSDLFAIEKNLTNYRNKLNKIIEETLGVNKERIIQLNSDIEAIDKKIDDLSKNKINDEKNIKKKYDEKIDNNNQSLDKEINRLSTNRAQNIPLIEKEITELNKALEEAKEIKRIKSQGNQVYRLAAWWYSVPDIAQITKKQIDFVAGIWFGSIALIAATIGTVLALIHYIMKDPQNYTKRKKLRPFRRLYFALFTIIRKITKLLWMFIKVLASTSRVILSFAEIFRGLIGKPFLRTFRLLGVGIRKRLNKPIIKEKVVEKEVEVVKEVEIIKEVEVAKPVEVIKEVPVEKVVIKEVPKEIIRKELKYVPLYSSESGLVDAPKDVKEDKKK